MKHNLEVDFGHVLVLPGRERDDGEGLSRDIVIKSGNNPGELAVDQW